jgi:hypothetical protein
MIDMGSVSYIWLLLSHPTKTALQRETVPIDSGIRCE